MGRMMRMVVMMMMMMEMIQLFKKGGQERFGMMNINP